MALVMVVLAGGAIYFAYASHNNRVSAERWRARAGTLQRTLTGRTRQLNRRTHALNNTAERLDRSEADVRKLESRQRQLANEKAQVEDARGLLAVKASSLNAIASEQRDCSSGLATLLDHFAGEDYAWVDANIADIAGTCNQASDDFATFESDSGG